MLLLFSVACFWSTPASEPDHENVRIEQVWMEIQPEVLIDSPNVVRSFLTPCLTEPMNVITWEGSCSYDNLSIQGFIQLTEDKLIAEHFSVLFDDKLEFYIDGFIDYSEQDDLLRIESIVYLCEGQEQCQTPLILHALVSSIYPNSSYPEYYETTVSGLISQDSSHRIDASWLTNIAECTEEPSSGFIGIGDIELQMNGSHQCDGCALLHIQGVESYESCNLFLP